jgi:hypothetical protein
VFSNVRLRLALRVSSRRRSRRIAARAGARRCVYVRAACAAAAAGGHWGYGVCRRLVRDSPGLTQRARSTNRRNAAEGERPSGAGQSSSTYVCRFQALHQLLTVAPFGGLSPSRRRRRQRRTYNVLYANHGISHGSRGSSSAQLATEDSSRSPSHSRVRRVT